MAGAVERQYVMLKPMAAGVSGFARLETSASHALLHMTVKGLRQEQGLRVYFFEDEGRVGELAHAPANRQGHISLTAEIPIGQMSLSPARMRAILVQSDEESPSPLAIGLCARESAGSLLDAKNALLMLCTRMQKQEQRQQTAARSVYEIQPITPEIPEKECEETPPIQFGDKPECAGGQEETKTEPQNRRASPEVCKAVLEMPLPPQEVFLPAIHPDVYITAMPPLSIERAAEPESGKNSAEEKAQPISAPTGKAVLKSEEKASLPQPVKPRGARLPVQRLRALKWPQGYGELAQYFDTLRPCAPLDTPGWRFVRVPMARGGSFAVGRWVRGGCVARVCYAVAGGMHQTPPKEYSAYRWQQGCDGQGYWVLWLDAK